MNTALGNLKPHKMRPRVTEAYIHHVRRLSSKFFFLFERLVNRV